MKLLHIDSSISGEGSATRRISTAVVEALRATHPGLAVARRDLDDTPVPHLDSRRVGVVRPDLGAATATALADAEQILQEFMAADIIVIGAPMYNFGIPSQLKAWIDHVVVGGRTFRYGDNGPEGLAGGKRVIIASARGGRYADGAPLAALDFQETYLRAVFGFIGVVDVEFVRAEGLAMGPEGRDGSLRAALAGAAALADPAPALAA
ncbi:MAG TPA: FMN-dependent NADH-azoreductase [Caulobacteraceae bacterium]|nr:FMN-dependent NADH-azoreductase [Caulobacteraceae bacterium]